MTLPRGTGSGKGRAFLSSACGKAPAKPKPRKPLARKAPLSAASATGSTLKRTAGPKPSCGNRSKGTPDQVGAWREAAFQRVIDANDGYLVDESTGLLIVGKAVVHHPLEAGDLFTMGVARLVVAGHPLVLHPDNSMVLEDAVHKAHHAPGVKRCPLPLSAIRPETWALVDWLDERAGNQWWRCRMEGDHE